MNLDLLHIATIAGAIITIASLAKLVVEPFRVAMRNNDKTMRHLESTIKELTRDIQENQRETVNVRKVIDNHELRIGLAEDDIIRLQERTTTKKEGK